MLSQGGERGEKKNATYMVPVVLHEKLLVCRRKNPSSFAPGIVSRYKISKPLCLVAKLFIEVSLLTKMICIAAINDGSASILTVVIRLSGGSFQNWFCISRKLAALLCSYTHSHTGI
jgi:hypothetical protein